MSQCGVCQIETPKYKCSTCRLPYCSLTCYKAHKEMPCQPPQSVNSNQTSPPRKTLTEEREEDEDSTSLTVQQLQQIGYSDKVRKFLKYPQIRELVTKVDLAADPGKLLTLARKEDPVFEEFIEALLSSINTQ